MPETVQTQAVPVEPVRSNPGRRLIAMWFLTIAMLVLAFQTWSTTDEPGLLGLAVALTVGAIGGFAGGSALKVTWTYVKWRRRTA